MGHNDQLASENCRFRTEITAISVVATDPPGKCLICTDKHMHIFMPSFKGTASCKVGKTYTAYWTKHNT